MPRAFVTGVTGQDGSYLADLLRAEGCEVVGLVRDPDTEPVPDGVATVAGDLLDAGALRAAILEVAPDEIYHLAAPTFVPASWEDPTETIAAIAGATAALLAAALAASERPRVWVSTSSEIFGDAGETPQHERSPMRPRSPYGVAKLAAHGLVGALRGHHGLFACSGITYNHESPRRPLHFVTRKITRGAAAIALGLEDQLVLGDLGAVRDWSHAEDVMRAAVLALRAPEPDDYVIASGRGHTVRDLVAAAFARAGVDPGGRVRVDPAFVRAPEPTTLIGDPSRARAVLGWEPRHSFEALVAQMVDADLAELGARRL
ncbi:MAG: GDP-mannose 4,6-dehydratase [Actinomycetota bacterium]|nr:GDP-mannose 4,6-dehydratase [Actinomycetota bacterium]